MADILFREEEKWNLWEIFSDTLRPLLGVTASPWGGGGGKQVKKSSVYTFYQNCEFCHNSPFERFQSTALSATFSSGSPTSSPSSSTREWHVASTHCVSNGDSRAGTSSCFFPLSSELLAPLPE